LITVGWWRRPPRGDVD